MKLMHLMILVSILMTFAQAQTAEAASPPQPTYGTAVVDGDISEWDLTNDFFANMYRAGNPAFKVESKAYLRYDCNTHTLYVLVLAVPGVKALAQGWETAAWGAIGTVANKVYTGNSGNPPTPPQFAWVNQSADKLTADGYEASFIITPGTPTSPAFYSLFLHVEVYDENTSHTSATSGSPRTGIPLELICCDASIDLQKSYTWTTGNGSHVGDVVTYTYTVTNTGNGPLNSITVDDDVFGSITLASTTLNPGESTTGNATLTLTQELLDIGFQINTADASGTTPIGCVVTDSATQTVTFLTTPSIEVVKDYEWTTGNGSHVGDVVTYTYTVTNTGNVTLDPVSLTDDKYGTITLAVTSLAPGEYTTGTATLTLTQELLDAGSQTNVATATGTPPTGPDVTNTATKTVTFITTPAIHIIKTFEWTKGDGTQVGDEVTYTYTVTNAGNVTLDPVSVSDDQFGNITLLDTSLSPGESTTGTKVLVVTQELLDQGTLTNIATATGTPPSGPDVTDTDSQTVTFGGGASIDIKKTYEWTTGDGSHVGDVVTYTFTVKNTGTVTLDPVSVTDDVFGSITLSATSLAPGESATGTATLTLTQELLDAGSETNTATATGTPPSGPDVTETSTQIVTFLTTPAIKLVKDFAWTTGDGSHVGDVVTYTYTVTNEGNVTLDPVSVSDDKLGSITLLATSLAPGESTTGTATLTLTQELLDAGSQTNTATATGTPPSGPDVTSTSTRTVTFITSPAIDIQKTFEWTTGNGSHVGDVVTYTYTVTNTGNVTLNPVSVTDDILGTITLLDTNLAPGESTTGTATLTLTQELLDAGSQTNIATATGTPPSGPDITEATSQTVNFLQIHNIGLVKYVSVDGGTTWIDANTPPGPSVLIGNTVDYRYDVTNTGNVTLTDLTLIDDKLGPIPLSPTTLAPQGSLTVYDSTTALSGLNTNIATATGTPPIGPDVQVTDPANYTGKDSLFWLPQACETIIAGPSQYFMGYLGVESDMPVAVPGVLAIVPGDNWSYYVGAAQDGVEYTLKNVTMQKETPEIVQCADVFPEKTITQQGTTNIRLWWPLMYEVPGTTWTLSILYGTQTPYDDDGNGPNQSGYVHSNTWEWTIDADIESMSHLIDLFHELPFGKDEVPLISDEALYGLLQAKLIQIQDLIDVGDTVNAGLMLSEFELMVMDACIAVSPVRPYPTGNGTGIANSEENPACCKLLADAEYISRRLGIFIQKK
ncbi:hypothetical protein LLG46_14595 [bacterium]|nr:hypothetical protein [bacterium]